MSEDYNFSYKNPFATRQLIKHLGSGEEWRASYFICKVRVAGPIRLKLGGMFERSRAHVQEEFLDPSKLTGVRSEGHR